MDEMHTTTTPPGFTITPLMILGLLICFVGVVFTLDELGVLRAVNYLRFWPIALIAIGVLKLLQARDGGGAFAGLIFAFVGVWFQAEELDLIRISLRDVWPLALVLFGGYLVWQGMGKRGSPLPTSNAPQVDPVPTGDPGAGASPWSDVPRSQVAETTSRAPQTSSRATDTNSTMTAMAVMGGVSRGINSSNFRGGDLLAIMGGCEIDLRKAAIHGEAVIDIFVMWGGIEIRVPEDWTVITKVFPLMAGVEDTTRPPQGATAHRLILRGTAVMSGIEIKN
jgi:predicted membrane protein